MISSSDYICKSSFNANGSYPCTRRTIPEGITKSLNRNFCDFSKISTFCVGFGTPYFARLVAKIFSWISLEPNTFFDPYFFMFVCSHFSFITLDCKTHATPYFSTFTSANLFLMSLECIAFETPYFWRQVCFIFSITSGVWLGWGIFYFSKLFCIIVCRISWDCDG